MKFIDIYNNISTYNLDVKNKLDNLPYYLVLTDDNDKVYLKNKLIFHYNVTDYLINNIQPLYNNKLPLISRCDLFKEIIIDGEEVDLSDKVREPYQFKTTGNNLTFELGSLILTDNGFNENYVLTKHFDKPKKGIIEVVLNQNIETLIGGFMFDLCLTNIDEKSFKNLTINSLNSIFSSCSNLNEINLSYLNTDNVNDMFSMFANCNNITSISKLNFNTSNVTDMNSMFLSCNNLITLDLTHFNTEKVTNMYSMFLNCKKLEELNLNSFITNNVTDMESMFNGCVNLTHLYIDNFTTNSLTDYSNMFKNCNSLKFIQCKQDFKNWCISHQNDINLPDSMKDSGNGIWNII